MDEPSPPAPLPPDSPRLTKFASWLQDRLLDLAERLTSFDVTLPLDSLIQWPTSCSICTRSLADRTWPLRVARPGAFAGLAQLLLLMLGPLWLSISPIAWTRRFDVPVCPECHRTCRNRRWKGRILPLLVLLPLLLLGLAATRWIVGLYPHQWFSTLATAVVLITAIGTAIIVGLCYGLPVDVRAEKNDVTFTFETRDAADQFAALNDAHVDEPEDDIDEIRSELPPQH